jgi:hypothetical protein
VFENGGAEFVRAGGFPVFQSFNVGFNLIREDFICEDVVVSMGAIKTVGGGGCV